MLRRMRNENDQGSIFCLHRVRLRSDLVFEPGWRDENSAKVTTFDLVDQGIDGIRCLNAYEAIGSLSLAVVRNAIESDAARRCAGRGDRHTARCKHPQPAPRTAGSGAHHRSPACGGHPDTLDRLRQKLITQIGNAVFLTRPEAPDAIRELKRFVVDLCLSGLSPVARDDFLRSLCSPKPEDAYEKDRAWLEKFMGLAA